MLVARSNVASAIVEVTPDKVFDTASIIGKVFEDHNGDGFQADATAFDMVIKADIDPVDYVPGSTVLIKAGVEKSLDDISLTASKESNFAYGVEIHSAGDYDHGYKNHLHEKAKEAQSKLSEGVEVPELFGISRNRTLAESNTIAFQVETKSDKGFDFTVVTDSGTEILFKADGSIETNHHGDKAKGLSAENLDVTRDLYKDGHFYLWEITVENKGIYESGVPGVRLLTVEGIIIETDQYGRYHVPDQWVLDKKGKNFLLKVDTDSLPTGMKVISENPKVQRISPNKLTKFNFSVAVEEQEDREE